jgi:hypothetical protein
MWVLLISLTATAIAQAGLAVVCFVRYPGTLLPAILLASLALSYATFATIGGGWLATFQQASSIDPVADWVDLLIQQVVVRACSLRLPLPSTFDWRFPFP